MAVHLSDILAPVEDRHEKAKILVAALSAAHGIRAVPPEGLEWLVDFIAQHGLVWASRRWLAEKMKLKVGTEKEVCRTFRRLLAALDRARVLVVLAARGARGGTLLALARGQDVDKAALARAALDAVGEPEQPLERCGPFRPVLQPLRRAAATLRTLPDRAVEILHRVAGQIGQTRPIDSDSEQQTPEPSSDDKSETPLPAPEAEPQPAAPAPEAESSQNKAVEPAIRSIHERLLEELYRGLEARGREMMRPRWSS